MVVRNYDTPDPVRVVGNIKKVLETGQMTLLQKGAYTFLITHCGFIAHYDQNGFIETYRGDMPRFVNSFLTQHGSGWESWINNRGSYLYDVSYRGKLLAEIIQELIPIFTWQQPAIEAAHNDQRQLVAVARLRALAEELGYDLTKKTEAE